MIKISVNTENLRFNHTYHDYEDAIEKLEELKGFEIKLMEERNE